ncbi:hypothetical protein EC919_111158 [Pseudomonas graminis]|uniref:hypothetical protein n=1 Tax=Pseudomonas graminis TaxID=158627 RepID=UPI001061C90F|nr:hypothetical protein [Pseudomonas graminis]TDV46565.1 hypothetical protein EC919_111158 [Pseudomonas graminis]
MTTHLIEYDDVAYLGFNIGYMEKLPQYIEAFKIKLDLVPEAEYGKYREPAMDQVVATARQGSSLWHSSAKQLRALHQDTKKTLTDMIALLDSNPFDSRVAQFTKDMLRHEAEFKRQQAECDWIIECTRQTIPRFMDFMNVRTYEYAERKRLLVKGKSSNLPKTLNSGVTDESSLASARSSLEWHRRAYNTAILSAGNMGAYCSRLSGLLNATLREIHALKPDQSARRLTVSCQSAASAAREAQRLINYTLDNIFRFSI